MDLITNWRYLGSSLGSMRPLRRSPHHCHLSVVHAARQLLDRAPFARLPRSNSTGTKFRRYTQLQFHLFESAFEPVEAVLREDMGDAADTLARILTR